MKKLLTALVSIALFLAPTIAFAQFTTTQGGTGTSSPSGILYGDGTIRLKTVIIGSNLTFTGGTLSATGGGGSAYPFPLTGNATSTLTQFNAGLTAFGSSTIGDGTKTGGLTVSGTATTTALIVTGLGAGTVNSTSLGSLYNTATSSLSVGSPLTITGTAGALIGGTNLTINCQAASGSQAGCLSATDWTTFNNKQTAGNYITALTGDVTASGPGSSAATLATVNSNVGSFTNANITVNAKGLITAASNGTGGSSSYDFPLTGNATSTKVGFNGGLTSLASTTIGNGTRVGGLTISGMSTTTDRALFNNDVAVVGSIIVDTSGFGNSGTLINIQQTSLSMARGFNTVLGWGAEFGNTGGFNPEVQVGDNTPIAFYGTSVSGTSDVSLWRTGTNQLTLGSTVVSPGGAILGISSTTPNAQFAVHALYGNVPPGRNMFLIASSSLAATTTLFRIDNNGHVNYGGALPTCGTGCSSIAGNDNGGVITTSAAATSVTLNFARTWATAPVCVISDNSTTATGDVNSVSTTALTTSFSVGITGVIYYQCNQYTN